MTTATKTRTVVVVESAQEDLGAILKDLAKEVREELRILELEPEFALEKSFKDSTLCVTLKLDGVPVAIAGVVPDTLVGGNAACIWSLGTKSARLIPVTVARVWRALIANFLSRYLVLYNVVDARYLSTIRLLRMCGADFHDALPYGPKGALCRFFSIRRA